MQSSFTVDLVLHKTEFSHFRRVLELWITHFSSTRSIPMYSHLMVVWHFSSLWYLGHLGNLKSELKIVLFKTSSKAKWLAVAEKEHKSEESSWFFMGFMITAQGHEF